MNKFGICFQLCNEHFKPGMFLFSIDNGAMNAPRYWQLRNELLRDIGNGTMNSSAMAALQREQGTSVQLLKKATQVPPIPTAR
jgi:hypothetical protein